MPIDVKTHKYDIRFIRLLSLLVIGMRNLAQGDMHPAVMQFIKSIYEVRVGENVLRLLQMEKIIDEYIKEIKVKAMKKQNSA